MMMSIRRAGRSAVLGVALALGLVVAPARGDDPVEPGTLSGRVVDPAGQGVAGVRVGSSFPYVGTTGKRTTFEARTDADGRFRTGPLDPAYLTSGLVADAAGFARWTGPSSTVSIYPGVDHDIGTIRLNRGRTFAGRVVDADGTPRAATPVQVQVSRAYRGHLVGYAAPQRDLTTDADGRFRTDPLPVGKLGVAVRVPDRRAALAPRRPILPGPGEEDLGEIRLEADVPYTATVRDEAGRPVVGLNVGGTVGVDAVTGGDGRFTVRGQGPDFRLFVRLRRQGYREIVGFLTVDAGGSHFLAGPPDASPSAIRALPIGPERVRDMVFVLERAGTIEGMAVDAATGQPVPIEQVRFEIVERQPGGAVVLKPTSISARRLAEGRFVATYTVPGEYRLVVSAEDHREAELFVPTGPGLTAVRGVIARLEPKGPGPAPAATTTITGTATRAGRPVRAGWAALWTIRKPSMAPDAALLHGRTVADGPYVTASAPIVDGAFALDVPPRVAAATLADDRYLVVEEPGQAPTQVGPIALGDGESKVLDVACTPGGRVRGTVAGVPADWRGHAFIVAFTRAGLRAEAPIEPDGTFVLPPLPPGEYGLKAGHDAFEDAETFPGTLVDDHPEAYQQVADPWKRAVRVTIATGRDAGGVVVPWPE